MTVAIIEERLAALDTLKLHKGGGQDPEHACVMQATAWIAGEPWSDHPSCVSPVLGAFLRAWNDALDDDGRQRLKAYIPRLVGTAGDGQDEARAWLATDWLVRVCAPAWLELAGVKESSAALRALPAITAKTCAAAQPTIVEAKKAGDAARDAAIHRHRAAARDAARDAAGDAAWDAARAAARDAAGDAAWDAARAAAWDAARDAARAAAGAAARDAAWAAAGAASGAAAMDAARDAAWAAARDAARDAAGDAAWDAARAAAWDAAGAALEPTKVSLQASGHELLERLIDPAGSAA